jgi:hypothetical protein
MSISEVRRFAIDLRSNAALRAEAEKDQVGKSHGTPLARCVTFAEAKGYSFTVEEAKQGLKARAANKGKELSDAELDGIAAAGCMHFDCYQGGNGQPGF